MSMFKINDKLFKVDSEHANAAVVSNFINNVLSSDKFTGLGENATNFTGSHEQVMFNTLKAMGYNNVLSYGILIPAKDSTEVDEKFRRSISNTDIAVQVHKEEVQEEEVVPKDEVKENPEEASLKTQHLYTCYLYMITN